MSCRDEAVWVPLGGALVGFTANYRARTGGRWVEVVRYDTDHGHLHLHRFWRTGTHEVEELEAPGHPTDDYTDDLEEAERDLVENRRRYREKMEDHLR